MTEKFVKKETIKEGKEDIHGPLLGELNVNSHSTNTDNIKRFWHWWNEVDHYELSAMYMSVNCSGKFHALKMLSS